MSINQVDLSQYVTGRPQRKKSVREAIFYVVSCLTPPVYNPLDYQYLRGFKPLSSKEMNIMTRNRFNDVKTILMNPNVSENGPILLSDNLSIPGVKHTGYKLNQWVLEENKSVEVELDEKYDTRCLPNRSPCIDGRTTSSNSHFDDNR